MVQVKFTEVSVSDPSDYIFTDKQGVQYHLYSDVRGKDVVGLSPAFWDAFYFCEKIQVDYKNVGAIKEITNVISFK